MNSNPYTHNLLADLFPPDDPEEAARPAGPGSETRVGQAEPAGGRDAVRAPAPEPARPRLKESVLQGDEAAAPGHGRPAGRIVAVVNQKGGVGKTTTTINLGAALAEEGAKVLAVDFDPQGALSVGLGFDPNEIDGGAYDLLLDPVVGLDDVVIPSRVANLDVVPSNIDLSAAEVQLVPEVAREHLLQRCLEPARARWDYVLIDCPPSLGLLTVNALTAADALIVPLECEYFSLRAMSLLMDTVDKVKERLNPQLAVLGILPTMVDLRTIHGREVLERVSAAFGDKLFKTAIRKTIKFAEAPVTGMPLLSYAPRSNGAQQYRDLAREVLDRAS